MNLRESLIPTNSRRGSLVRASGARILRPAQRLRERLRHQGVDKETSDEERKLKQSWAGHAPDMLDRYLVTGYQDPRINAQSILARHFFVAKLFGSEFDTLMAEELAFCVEMNEAVRRRAAELGVQMGVFLDPEKYAAVQQVSDVIADRVATFQERWRAALAARTAEPISVLEFACGSANDYRALVDYGLADYIDYTGVDLNEKNIHNAKERFPHVNFEVASILQLPYADRGFDYVLAFDIFEHLSLSSFERALGEAMRTSGKGLVLSFFIMSDAPEHTERPKRNYHWNELSAPTVADFLRTRYSSVQVTHIPTLLREKFGYAHSYNKKAYTIIAEGPRR